LRVPAKARKVGALAIAWVRVKQLFESVCAFTFRRSIRILKRIGSTLCSF
jgi:hypothetical protein